MLKKGYLIIFTGIDGSGKTTQAKILLPVLQARNYKVSYAWSRWDPVLVKSAIRRWKKKVSVCKGIDYESAEREKANILSNPIVRFFWICTFFIDYGVQVFFKVTVKLFTNQVVISDRLHYDSIIDQEINLRGHKASMLKGTKAWMVNHVFPRPDLVFFIDCPEEVAFSRKKDAPNLEYLQERRKLYMMLADKHGWIKIDGALPVEQIAEIVLKTVENKVKSN